MIKLIEEYEKYMTLIGMKEVHVDNPDPLINEIRKKHPQVEIQFFNASLVAGWEHLYFAAVNALKAFKNGTNISRSVAVEVLLYASAQRQIKAAVDLVGLRQSTHEIVVLGIADTEKLAAAILETSKLIPGVRDDSVIDFHDDKTTKVRDLFEITDIELASNSSGSQDRNVLLDLVIEHMALLVTRR